MEWEVNEVQIKDRYEVTLHATYETDVPAAVVVMEPQSIDVSDMRAGDVMYGELTLTNYGLIKAEEARIDITGDDFFNMELLVEIPATISPHERIVIPYKIYCIKTVVDELGQATGGFSICCSEHVKVLFNAYSICPNGIKQFIHNYLSLVDCLWHCLNPVNIVSNVVQYLGAVQK